ncbi:multicopper oxidase family protein [Granulicella arctica]|uniref:Spore coat protein A n=1 Tax=Granulicella arctica TaxID=940613 RepID=A0A7Y9PFJ6_9BACT|nr:multicopper oxidase [Granulicella arctica]NYF78997.1 spore coat protein A [Granulicella arctica]
MASPPQVRSDVKLTRYVDPLPIPPVVRSTGKTDEVITIEMRQFQHRVHRDLPPTTLWGYNSSWPGPTIEAQSGQSLNINWVSKLPTTHLLPIDHSIHGAEASLPPVRNVAHLHGACALPEDDGYPEAWFTAHGEHGPRFNPRPSHYPNCQPSTTLWYHDHCLGITRLNVYAGLAGFYLIRDEAEKALNLPQGEFEIPLMLQDRLFHHDGSLFYPKVVNGPKEHPVWIQEFFGDMNCVNGKVMPFLEVEPRRYRLRILNASNSRFYHLRLFNSDANGNILNESYDVPSFQQIGTDGGLLPSPVELHYLLIAPAERFDIIVDFSDCAGKSFSLINDAPAPYTMGGQYLPEEVMLFKVGKLLSGKDSSAIPDTLVPFELLNPSFTTHERMLLVSERERSSDGYVIIGLLGNARWHEPITEDPKAGSTEIWSFVNITSDVHPLHVHLVQFQVLNRQSFDVLTYQQTGKLVFTGKPMAPESNERPARKDTIKSYPGYVTRVIMRFDLPHGTEVTPGQEFLYVWHCHILEHEDNEMMRPYKVIA